MQKIIKWLKGNENENVLVFLFKRAIVFFVSAILIGSLIGIPLFILGLREWNAQGADVIKVAHGSQGYPIGSTQIQRVKEVFNKIQFSQPKGIEFNKDKIRGYISGGVCSAMSLDFANEYLKIKKQGSISNETPLEHLVEKIQNIFTKYDLSRTDKSNHKLEFMNRQEAFNCIEIDPTVKNVDCSLAKVTALANFYDLRISPETKEFTYRFQEEESEIETLQNAVTCLPTGVHFIRDILPRDNEKCELHGHSMVLIKENKGTFFYDPNYGISLMNKNIPFNIYKILKTHFQDYKTHQFRFYKLGIA